MVGRHNKTTISDRQSAFHNLTFTIVSNKSVYDLMHIACGGLLGMGLGRAKTY